MSSSDVLAVYDILNNGMCPFCHKNLKNLPYKEDEANIRLRHRYCPSGHCKVMFETDNLHAQWKLIRVYFSNDNASIELWKDSGISKDVDFRYKSSRGRSVFLPHFNILKYSLVELEEKIKVLLVFL
jgi:hypothetical protein